MVPRRPPRASGSSGRATRCFAMTVEGLGGLLAAEVREYVGAKATKGFDGRSDLCLFELEPAAVPRLTGLRLAEDVFVEVGRTLRSEGDDPRWIANRIWRSGRAERALSAGPRRVGAHRPNERSRRRNRGRGREVVALRGRLVRRLRHESAVRTAVSAFRAGGSLARGVTRELARVTREGGRVVLLAPELPASSLPSHLAVTGETHIRLLGTATAIWELARSDEGARPRRGGATRAGSG
jgi:hypothetical protein